MKVEVRKKYKKLEFPNSSTRYVEKVKVVGITKFGNGKTVVTYRKYFLPWLWSDEHMEYGEFANAIESN